MRLQQPLFSSSISLCCLVFVSGGSLNFFTLAKKLRVHLMAVLLELLITLDDLQKVQLSSHCTIVDVFRPCCVQGHGTDSPGKTWFTSHHEGEK